LGADGTVRRSWCSRAHSPPIVHAAVPGAPVVIRRPQDPVPIARRLEHVRCRNVVDIAAADPPGRTHAADDSSATPSGLEVRTTLKTRRQPKPRCSRSLFQTWRILVITVQGPPDRSFSPWRAARGRAGAAGDAARRYGGLTIFGQNTTVPIACAIAGWTTNQNAWRVWEDRFVPSRRELSSLATSHAAVINQVTGELRLTGLTLLCSRAPLLLRPTRCIAPATRARAR